MAYPSNLLQADWKRVLGAGMMCSVLALGTAFAQEAAPAAADAAAQTEGQREAADAAKYLAEGGEDEPHVREAPAPDAHRVYVGDPAHFAAITQQFIINGSDGTVEGMLDGGFLPNPVVTDDGSMIAQASTVFSRISRGERTDYVEVYDPKTLLPTAVEKLGVRVFHDMREGLKGVDVVMMLRLQNERMNGALLPTPQEYYKIWGLTAEKLALAKPDAIVMHPGPMNRGVEIDSAVADGAQAVILPQVTFGIAVRMAVMSMLGSR